MAGSYNHATTDDGKLRSPETMSIATETGGDAYETIEEMYGMIWWLARVVAVASGGEEGSTAEAVERARSRYREGLSYSPGHEDI